MITQIILGLTVLSRNLVVFSAPADAASIAGALEKEALKIPKELFKGDGLLIQSVDSSGPKTTYSCSESHDVIFVRTKENDSGKDAIVLKEDQDNIPSCNGDTKTHVVLVKTSGGYSAVIAYVRERVSTDKDEDVVTISGGRYRIEWDSWSSRESHNNKAQIFGWTSCSYSNFAPCKEVELMRVPKSNSENILPKRDITSDFMCDIAFTKIEANFFGGVVSALNTAVIILNGADMVYKDEMKLYKNIVKSVNSVIKTNTQNGRAFGMTLNNIDLLSNISETAAQNVIEKGKAAISSGVLMFVVLGGAIGSLAVSMSPNSPIETNGLNVVDGTENITEALKDIKAEISSSLGSKLMAAFTNGNSRYGGGVNPDPTLLLNLDVARHLAKGSSGEIKLGRGFGNEGTRIYNADIQRDGSKTGSIAADTWNAGTKNLAQEYGKKSTGQVFAENLKLGWHLPLGAVEDVANSLGKILGQDGKVSDDRSYIDDLLDKTTKVIASTAGPIVDVAADILAPLGLGPLAHAAANIASGALGIVGGGISQVVLGPYNLIKTGLKSLGLGGLIGMKGSKARVQKADGIVNTERDGPSRAEMDAYTASMGWGTGAKVIGHGYKGQGMLVSDQYKVESGKGPPNVQVMAPPGGYPVGQGYPVQPNGNGYGYARRKRSDDKQNSGKTLPDLDKIPISLATNVDIFSHFGWKSVDISVRDLMSANTTEDKFIGFGSCPQKPEIPEEWNDPEKLAEFYTNIMRTDCLTRQKQQLQELFSQKGLLHIEADKPLSIQPDSALLTKKKLANSEIGELSRAFEICALSKVLQNTLHLKNPSGDKIDINIGVLQAMTMEYLEQVLQTSPTHAVKLIRNLATTLKTVMVKVMQDFYRYNACQKCSKEQIGDADYDMLTSFGLFEFVVTSWKDYTSTKDNGQIMDVYNAWFVKMRNNLIEQLALFVF